MKKIVNWLIVIGVILLVIFLQHKYFPTVTTITTTDTIWKDTGSVSYIPKPYPVYIDTSRTDTIIIPADSLAIVQAYIKLHQEFYSTYFYKDTVLNDSSMFIEIGTKISQNKPLNYSVTYFDKTPTVINNITNIYAKNEFFIGAEVGLNNFSPGLVFSSKKGYLIEGNYDVLNSQIKVGAYVNINKLKLW